MIGVLWLEMAGRDNIVRVGQRVHDESLLNPSNVDGERIPKHLLGENSKRHCHGCYGEEGMLTIRKR